MPKRRKAKRSLLSRLTKRPLLTFAVILVLLVGGGFAYVQLRGDQPSIDSSDDQGGYVTLNPPTEEEKQEAEANKRSIAEDTPPPPPPSPSGKKQVTPVITYANRSEVRAYVPGIFEEGGKCTAIATKGSETKTAGSSAFANVSYTSCSPILWSLSSGNWSVVVSYSSSTAQGKSESQIIY